MKKKKNQTSVYEQIYTDRAFRFLYSYDGAFFLFRQSQQVHLRVVANVTVIPLQQGINQIGGWMGDMKDNFQTLKQVQAENEKLQEQVDALITENNYLQEERYELETASGIIPAGPELCGLRKNCCPCDRERFRKLVQYIYH